MAATPPVFPRGVPGIGAACWRIILALLLTITLGHAHAAAQPEGRFVEIPEVPTQTLAPPHIVVWLPPGYDRGTQRYPVVYMHDGQNLFFPARSNFNKVWAADRSASRLIAAKRVRPFIIVGIDHPGNARQRQYLPARIYAAASPELKVRLDALAQGQVTSDAYLRFIVNDLKPLIDRRFRTQRSPRNTAIVGSSMGGLISCYAFGEYPQVFGRAGCVSTHWPMSVPSNPGEHLPEIDRIWGDYLARRLGRPDGRRLWFDHGTETLDAAYAPYQRAIDARMIALGWRKGRDFESRVYPGAAHEENAWAARMDDIFGWLMR